MPNRESTPSSRNVFADLNLPHADDLLANAELAAKIIAELHRRRLTQSQAAEILGIDQPRVSAPKQGKLSGFSVERLLRLLLWLGRDVEITVKGRSRPGSAARLRVAWLSDASLVTGEGPSRRVGVMGQVDIEQPTLRMAQIRSCAMQHGCSVNSQHLLENFVLD